MIKLVRLNDNKEFTAEDYRFVTFDESGKGKSMDKIVGIGKALILPPFNMYFQWMTTVITEFTVSEQEINFKTENSHYKLIL